MKNTVPTEVPQDTAAVAALVASIQTERFRTVVRLVSDPAGWVPYRCVVCGGEANSEHRTIPTTLGVGGESYVTADVHAGGECLFSYGLFVTGWTRLDSRHIVTMGG